MDRSVSHLVRREKYAAETALDALSPGGVVSRRHELTATAPRAFMKYLYNTHTHCTVDYLKSASFKVVIFIK